MRRTVIAASVRCPAATQSGDLTELRLLVELSALRKLADRGLSDQEVTLVRKLADATIRSARRGDVLAYLQADMTFHLCLLELTGDPALSEIAALLLTPGPCTRRALRTRAISWPARPASIAGWWICSPTAW